MRLPSHIWHLRGKNQEGPTVIILGGTHGDELTGIEVVRTLLTRLDLLKEPAGVFERDDVCGNLFIGFGNPEAMLRCTRSASDGLDMNRSFTPQEQNAEPQLNDRADLKRARELAPLLASATYLFDIHGTSSPSEPFVCFGNDSPRHQEVYRLIPVRYILTDPHRIYTKHEVLAGELGTTDDYVNRHGGIGLCYEAGQARELEKMDAILGNVVNLLPAVRVVTEDFMTVFADLERTPQIATQEVYTIVAHVLPCAEGGSFSYAPGMDRGWQPVESGALIGHWSDGCPEHTPLDGLCIFQSAPHRIKKGKPFYCIAKKVSSACCGKSSIPPKPLDKN